MADLNIKNKRRLFALLSLMMLAFLGLIARLGYIQLVEADWLTEKALAQQVRDLPVEAKRGTIYDRNGKELAISITKYTVWAKPSAIKDKSDAAKRLSKTLGVEEKEVESMLKSDKKSLVRVARWIDEKPAKQIQKLEIGGVWVVKDNKRFYPYGNLAPYVIGHVSTDNAGQAGIELQYDKELKGLPGRIISVTDASGKEIPYDNGKYNNPKDGQGAILTIDEVIQHHLDKALDKALAENQAKNVMGIVMNPKTGEILAMSSKPDYDPNNPRNPIYPRYESLLSSYGEDKSKGWFDMWKNPLVNETYEPGSTFKPITVSAALEEGFTKESETFYCNGYVEILGRKIKCHVYPRGHGVETLAQAVQNSCNPVMIELARRMGTGKLYEYIKAFGLMSKTGIDLPGEQVGVFHNEQNVGPVELATIAFGQANSATPIQLISAISAIANDGILMKPHVVKEFVDSKGNVISRVEPEQVRKVISSKTARSIRNIMESVVVEGGAQNAFIPGYRVAGKTGTAQKVVNGRYEPGFYYASFVGMAPAENPEIAVLIIVDEPRGASHFGGTVAAPIAKEVIYDVLRYLNIKPNFYLGDSQNGGMVEESIVPEVRNMELSTALQLLSDNGLNYVIEPSNTVFNPDDMVLDMFPSPGTKLSAGSNVILYMKLELSEAAMAGGKSVVVMPDLTGKTIKEVTNILQGMGLKLKATGSGTAVSQEPKPNMPAEPGMAVSVEFKSN